jgi:hypothetical protein
MFYRYFLDKHFKKTFILSFFTTLLWLFEKHSRFAKRVNVTHAIEIHFFSKSLFSYWMAIFLPASSFMFYTPMELRFASQSAHSEMQKVQKLHSSNKNEQKCFFFFASIEIIQKQNLFILKLYYLLFILM